MIHKFKIFNNYIVLDVESGCVHIVDELTFLILDYVDFKNKEESLNNVLEKFKEIEKDELIKRFEELFFLYRKGSLFFEFDYKRLKNIAKESVIKALCLHVAHDCNLRCRYCFASTGDFKQGRKLMSYDTAKKAVDFLIERSLNRRNLEVDFFGGEPLLNFDVVKKTIEYARKIEKKYNKNFRFTITTNGMLLDSEKIQYINENMSNVILSIDGRKSINDSFRITRNLTGSYDIIMPKFLEFVKKRKDKEYHVRGTFTRYNLDFFKDFVHFYQKGFKNISIEPVVCEEDKEYSIKKEDLPKIFAEYEKLAKFIVKEKENGYDVNFFHFNIDLNYGPCIIKRLRGCGSGCEYLAVSPNGDLYPCHQFVGENEYFMGNLFENDFNEELKEKFSKTNLIYKKDCEKCWAKYYCGGGCNANNVKFRGSMLKPYLIGCEMEKKRVELAIGIKALFFRKDRLNLKIPGEAVK